MRPITRDVPQTGNPTLEIEHHLDVGRGQAGQRDEAVDAVGVNQRLTPLVRKVRPWGA